MAHPGLRPTHSATFADRLDLWTVWVVQPVALALTIAALFAPPDWPNHWPIALASVAVVLIFFEYLETVWSFAQPHARGKRRGKGLQLAFSGVMMVLAYSAIYQQLGVHDALDRETYFDAGTAIYFSVITTATVGYGDFVPTADARPFAALQSLMSVVWTGLFFGVIVSSLWIVPESMPSTPSDDSRSSEAPSKPHTEPPSAPR
jgi:hypothetical protein